MSKKIMVLTLIFLIFAVFAFAQEQLTLTTYYPSPYGSYRELRAQKMAIGDTWVNNTTVCLNPPCSGGALVADANADLVVEGNVGIGTVAPLTKLHVAGSGVGPDLARVLISSTNEQAGLFLRSDGTGDAGIYSPDNTDNLSVWVGNNNRLYVNTSGNVGIGTTTPQAAAAPNGAASGNADVNDVWLRSVGRWASQAGGLPGYQLVKGPIQYWTGPNDQNATVTCPAGKRVVGGGCTTSSNVTIEDSFPADDTVTWFCRGARRPDSGATTDIQAIAICMQQ